MKSKFLVLDAIDGDRTVDLKKIANDLQSIFCDLTYNHDNEVVEHSFDAQASVRKLISALNKEATANG